MSRRPQGGTLFLDEIGELSPALQVKLLRLVQEKTIKMIGDTDDIPVDVRIISATNRDLEHMVMEKTFREDLYYRFNVLPFAFRLSGSGARIFPFSLSISSPNSQENFGKDIRKISSYAIDILCNYEFPGNVRELEHIIERGVAMESSKIILPDSLTLSNYKRKAAGKDLIRATLHGNPRPGLRPRPAPCRNRKEDGPAGPAADGRRQDKAAQLLGITFRSFRYRLLKYGLATEDELKTGRIKARFPMFQVRNEIIIV